MIVFFNEDLAFSTELVFSPMFLDRKFYFTYLSISQRRINDHYQNVIFNNLEIIRTESNEIDILKGNPTFS